MHWRFESSRRDSPVGPSARPAPTVFGRRARPVLAQRVGNGPDPVLLPAEVVSFAERQVLARSTVRMASGRSGTQGHALGTQAGLQNRPVRFDSVVARRACSSNWVERRIRIAEVAGSKPARSIWGP